jgi:hypothetical protein
MAARAMLVAALALCLAGVDARCPVARRQLSQASSYNPRNVAWAGVVSACKAGARAELRCGRLSGASAGGDLGAAC